MNQELLRRGNQSNHAVNNPGHEETNGRRVRLLAQLSFLNAYYKKMNGRPNLDEAAPYYSTYINQAPGEDPLVSLNLQLEQSSVMLRSITEEQSLRQYAPGKWSLRQVLNHITDTERAFCFRTLWFARGFQDPLPGYDQNIAAVGAEADLISWTAHIEEFQRVRLATVSLVESLPAGSWLKTGVASGNKFTVRSLVWIISGHAAHHLQIMQDRYL
jgi:uncharacterized damage-inducible protein DinB